jgi:hypothetical protein
MTKEPKARLLSHLSKRREIYRKYPLVTLYGQFLIMRVLLLAAFFMGLMFGILFPDTARELLLRAKSLEKNLIFPESIAP